MKKCKHNWYYLGYINGGSAEPTHDLFWCKICGMIRHEGFPGVRTSPRIQGFKHKKCLFLDSGGPEFVRPEAARDSEIEWYRWALENFKGVAKQFTKHECWQWNGNTEEEGCGYCPPCQLGWALEKLEEE